MRSTKEAAIAALKSDFNQFRWTQRMLPLHSVCSNMFDRSLGFYVYPNSVVRIWRQSKTTDIVYSFVKFFNLWIIHGCRFSSYQTSCLRFVAPPGLMFPSFLEQLWYWMLLRVPPESNELRPIGVWILKSWRVHLTPRKWPFYSTGNIYKSGLALFYKIYLQLKCNYCKPN